MRATYPSYWQLQGNILSPIRDNITVDATLVQVPITIDDSLTDGDTITSTYTNMTQAGLLYLPLNPAEGDIYHIKYSNESGGALSANGGVIDGETQLTFGEYDSITVIFDGTVWWTFDYASELKQSLIAGEQLNAGEICYIKNDGKYWKAKGDSATTMPAVVMAAENIMADMRGRFYMPGSNVNNSRWVWTAGDIIYASAGTAGALTASAPAVSGDQVQIIGYATTPRTMYFNPSYVTVEIK